MIGGMVVETCDTEDGLVYVEAVCQLHGDHGAILLRPTREAKLIDLGDLIWWQGRKAFWTPQTCDGAGDIEIPRACLGGAELKR
jgi:hypothetical protein